MNQPNREPADRSLPRALSLLVIILLAFGLRVYHLDAQSLWYDEGVTADVAQRSIGELTRWTANDIQPPLYYYTVAAWGQVAGWREWSLRFPSAFFGVLTVPLLAVLAKRLIRRSSAGWLAALLAAVHPLLLYYSQEARMYASSPRWACCSAIVCYGWLIIQLTDAFMGFHPDRGGGDLYPLFRLFPSDCTS